MCNQFRELDLTPEVREVESFGPGNYAYAQLDYERASVIISGVGTYNKSRKAVANEVVQQVREFLKSGKACEKHLADQLLLPLNELLGNEWNSDWECLRWIIDIQKETLHYKTNKDVISVFAESLMN